MAEPAAKLPPLPRRIVVGLDEQGRADNAVRAALVLAPALDARLELIHALPPLPEAWPGLSPVESMQRSEELVGSARAAARAHVGALLSSERETRFATDELLRVVQGRPAQVLLAEARSVGDLVMLGGIRPSGLLEFGGTLRTLLARSAGPLWVQPYPGKSFQRILVPIDMSEHSLHALELAVAMASRLTARVHVLHAFHTASQDGASWSNAAAGLVESSMSGLRAVERARFEEVLAGFDWRGVEHEESFVEGAPVQAILDQAPAHDLIAMSTHGRSGLSAAVLGGVAWRVIERATKPLLVTRLPGGSFPA